MSDKSANLSGKRVRFARSATKHRVTKASIRHVISHCRLRFEEPPSNAAASVRDHRLIYLGDDIDGRALEVIAVEGDHGDLIVIHAMQLRARYTAQYEEAKRCQR